MMKKIISYLLPLLTLVLPADATLEVRTGLLHRLVQFYKNSFFNDLLHVAPVKLDVKIEPAPEGYQDPPSWEYDSVVRLLGLLRESDSQPARRLHDHLQQLREQPSRRYLGMGTLHKRRMRIKKKLEKCKGNPNRPGYPKYCPREGDKNARNYRKGLINRLYIPSFYNPNDMYYDEMVPIVDMRWDETGKDRNYTIGDDDILVISNPVEAKLPSGHISIGMLRRILETRAEAARVMPTKPPSPENDTTVGSDGNTTDVAEGGSNSTDVGEATTLASEGGTDNPGGEGKPTEGNGEDKPPDGEAPAEAPAEGER